MIDQGTLMLLVLAALEVLGSGQNSVSDEDILSKA
jgi:hypothetical protein